MLAGVAPDWRAWTDSIPTSVSGSGGLGSTVASGTSNADGSVVAIIGTALTHDVEWIEIYPYLFFTTGSNNSCLLDVVIDPAGGTAWDTTNPLINDLLVGCSMSTGSGAPIPLRFCFPLFIPRGSTIGVRVRGAHSVAHSGRVMIKVAGDNANPGSAFVGRHVESIGINAASSQGTNHTPGNNSAFSTWTNFGSTLTMPCRFLQFAVHGTNADTTTLQLGYNVEFGANSTRIGPKLYRVNTTSENGWVEGCGPVWHSLKAGTQLMVRAACSGTAEVMDVAAYAVS